MKAAAKIYWFYNFEIHFGVYSQSMGPRKNLCFNDIHTLCALQAICMANNVCTERHIEKEATLFPNVGVIAVNIHFKHSTSIEHHKQIWKATPTAQHWSRWHLLCTPTKCPALVTTFEENHTNQWHSHTLLRWTYTGKHTNAAGGFELNPNFIESDYATLLLY